MDIHTSNIDNQLQHILTLDLVLHQAHNAILALSTEIRDHLAPKAQVGVGKLLLQRMPRSLRTQPNKLHEALIPTSMISFQTSVRTTDPSTQRLCEYTTLVTRAQSPFFMPEEFQLTHRNIIMNKDHCVYVPDSSFEYLMGDVAIKWPFVYIMRNVTTCIHEIQHCQDLMIREPNCTHLNWFYFLFDHHIAEINRPVTIEMSCINGGKQTNMTNGISVAVFEHFCNYTISSLIDSQVIFIRALELTNAKLSENHINNRLQELRFLNASTQGLQDITPTQIMTPRTHEILSLVNFTLPLLIIISVGLIISLLYFLGKKVLFINKV